MITIYKTTNLINGKQYVGQRISRNMKCYYGSGKLIKQAIIKHGKENFRVEEIDYAYSSDEADQKETLWIQECDCLTPTGYNIAPTGGTTRGIVLGPLSDEARITNSIAQKKRYEDVAERIKTGNAMRGKKRPKHSALMIGNTNGFKKGEPSIHKGKKLSDEYKRKISLTLKRYYANRRQEAEVSL